MVVRCTKKMLALLGGRSVTLSELSPTDDDWYLNLVWIERQKCLLLVHAGTLFSVFRAGVRSADLRSLGTYLVDAVEAELRAKNLSAGTFLRPSPRQRTARQDREPQHPRLHDRDGLRASIRHHRHGRPPPHRFKAEQPGALLPRD